MEIRFHFKYYCLSNFREKNGERGRQKGGRRKERETEGERQRQKEMAIILRHLLRVFISINRK